jgi:hypothetical protein
MRRGNLVLDIHIQLRAPVHYRYGIGAYFLIYQKYKYTMICCMGSLYCLFLIKLHCDRVFVFLFQGEHHGQRARNIDKETWFLRWCDIWLSCGMVQKSIPHTYPSRFMKWICCYRWLSCLTRWDKVHNVSCFSETWWLCSCENKIWTQMGIKHPKIHLAV